MEVNNCTYYQQSFGSIYGDSSKIAEGLGNDALKIVIQQMKNDVADVFVGKLGDITIKARPGYTIPLEFQNPYCEKVKELDIVCRQMGEGFFTAMDNLTCRTSSGKNILINVPKNYKMFEFNSPTRLYGALSIADEAYRIHKGNMPKIDSKDMEKIIGTVINAQV